VSTASTWENGVREARAAIERPVGSPAPTAGAVVCAELGRRLERAHETAVSEAEQLAEEATRLGRRLAEEGMGATFGGNNFLAQAQNLRDALVRFEDARAAFAMARGIQERDGANRS
jgi:hypothetical protein